MLRSGWAAAAVTAVLVAGLGSEWVYDNAFDADRHLWPLLGSLTELPTWAPVTALSDGATTGAVAVKLVVLLVAAFGLGAAAGRSESAGAAFLAGWGGFALASALAGAAYYVAADLLDADPILLSVGGGIGVVEGLVILANDGAVFALYTGALVGGAVAIARRRTPRPFAALGAEPAMPYGAAPPSQPPRPSPHSGSAPGYPPPPAPPSLLPRPAQPPAPAAPTAPTAPTEPAPIPVASWPPTPGLGSTQPPSPSWAPPNSQNPLPAALLPRRGIGSRPVPHLPGDPAATSGLDAPVTPTAPTAEAPKPADAEPGQG